MESRNGMFIISKMIAWQNLSRAQCTIPRCERQVNSIELIFGDGYILNLMHWVTMSAYKHFVMSKHSLRTNVTFCKYSIIYHSWYETLKSISSWYHTKGCQWCWYHIFHMCVITVLQIWYMIYKGIHISKYKVQKHFYPVTKYSIMLTWFKTVVGNMKIN